jgi:hypothetical protein
MSSIYDLPLTSKWDPMWDEAAQEINVSMESPHTVGHSKNNLDPPTSTRKLIRLENSS